MTVTQQCLLNFQIGNLNEKVLCDVVEMDACHILLGKSWLFDKNVSHDGRENTYEFKQDGQWYKLTPMLENTMIVEENKDVNNGSSRIMLCSSKEVFKEQKRADSCLVVIPKRVQQMVKLNSAPLKILPLLNEFKEIMVDDLPIGLSPLRSISHQIDLMPGSSFPNEAPHRITPIHNEKVNKHAQELLDRGFIRESLSPCVVRAVLTPKKGGE